MQVRKRERMAKIREEIAVQKAKETELNKTIHITGSITQSNLTYQIYFNLFLQQETLLCSPPPINRGNYASKTNAGNNVSRDKISFVWGC